MRFFLVLLLLLHPLSAQAKNAPRNPEISRVQTQAFGLGYALRTADLRAVAYTKSVQTLKGVTDQQVAGAEVAHLSSEVPKLRRAEAASYTATGVLLAQMGAPAPLQAWAAQSAATLNATLIYVGDAKKLLKHEPATAAVLAELVEIQTLKSAAVAQQTPMTLWLALIGGKIAPWTADVGAYIAELRRSSHAASPSPLSGITARALLHHAPAGAPAATRESLAALVSSRGGNLEVLGTIAPADITFEKITHVSEALLLLYNATGQAAALDKSAA